MCMDPFSKSHPDLAVQIHVVMGVVKYEQFGSKINKDSIRSALSRFKCLTLLISCILLWDAFDVCGPILGHLASVGRRWQPCRRQIDGTRSEMGLETIRLLCRLGCCGISDVDRVADAALASCNCPAHVTPSTHVMWGEMFL